MAKPNETDIEKQVPGESSAGQDLKLREVLSVLESVDPNTRDRIIGIVASTSTHTFSSPGGMMDAVSRTLTGDHVQSMIANDEAAEKRAHEERGYVRRYSLLALLLVLLVSVWTISTFEANPTVLAGILGSIGGLVGGGVGGYGIGRSRRSRG